MNVFNMPDEIAIISDLMFPVPMLPDCLFSFMKMRCRLLSLELIPSAPAEMTFDLAPAHGIIVVVFRQGPYTMQMFWQQYKSIYSKRVPLLNGSKSFFQQRYV